MCVGAEGLVGGGECVDVGTNSTTHQQTHRSVSQDQQAHPLILTPTTTPLAHPPLIPTMNKQDGRPQVLGNKTEGALLCVVDQYGVDYDEVRVSRLLSHAYVC